jgi:hypothetical protein
MSEPLTSVENVQTSFETELCRRLREEPHEEHQLRPFRHLAGAGR